MLTGNTVHDVLVERQEYHNVPNHALKTIRIEMNGMYHYSLHAVLLHPKQCFKVAGIR